MVRRPLVGNKKASKLRSSQLSTPTIRTPQPQSTNGTPEPEHELDTSKRPTEQARSSVSTALQPQNLAIDVASKFGTTLSTPTNIPTAAQIAERKARRARLAQESQAALLSNNVGENSITNNSDFVSLDAYDSDGEFKPSRLQVSTFLRDDRASAHHEFTRLVPEDEHGDIAEGFESFVDPDDHHHGPSGRIHTSSINPTKARENEREAMRALINKAEGRSRSSSAAAGSHHDSNVDSHSDADTDSDEDENSDSDSDASQTAAYTTAQTAHGTSLSHLTPHQRRQMRRDAARPRAPAKTTPIPTVAAALQRIRALQDEAERARRTAEIRLAEVDRRLGEIEGEKARIQRGLVEVGAQLDGEGREAGEMEGERAEENRRGRGRGLDDIGAATGVT